LEGRASFEDGGKKFISALKEIDPYLESVEGENLHKKRPRGSV